MRCVSAVFLYYFVSLCSNGEAVENSKEVELNCGKYSEIKADLERLKADVRYLVEKEANKEEDCKQREIQSSTPQDEGQNSTEPPQNKTNKDENQDNTTATFRFHLLFASRVLLKDNTIQYVIEVEMSETPDSVCEFYQGLEKVVKEDVERQGNITRGTVTAFSDENVAFSCMDPKSAVEVTYYFRYGDIDANVTETEKTYPRTECKISIPEHEITDSLVVIKSNASCDGLVLNANTDFSLRGWLVSRDSLAYIGSSYYFKSTRRFSGGQIYAEFSEDKDSVMKEKNMYLLKLYLQIFHEAESLISTTKYSYYYPKGLDGQTPPIKPGTLAMEDFRNYYAYGKLRALTGSGRRLYCTAAANPSPELSWWKEGIELDGKQATKTLVWNGFVAWKKLEVTNITQRDVGNYSCKATSGNKTVTGTVEITLCIPPPVSFRYVQNNSMVQAVFQANNNGDMSVYNLDCYNSSTISSENIISYRYDGSYIPMVDLKDNRNENYFEKTITWKRSPVYAIPTRLYCRIDTACSNELQMFQMNI